METTKVLVRQKTIHYVQYSEYQLTDLAPDTNGEYKTELVIKLLKTYGLEDFINSYPSNLSGGMRQRCALIRTLATKPDILLL